jgi:hypothetical protein
MTCVEPGKPNGTYLRTNRVGAGRARDQEQKNKKTQMRRSCASCACGIRTSLCITQMHANKRRIFCFYWRSFAFSVSFNVVAGMARSYSFK